MLMIGDFLRRCYLETCFTTFGTDSQQHTVHSFLLKLWTCSTAAATKKTIRLLSLFKPPGAGHHADGCQIPLMQWCRTLRVCYLLIDANVETYPFCREYTHSVQRHHVCQDLSQAPKLIFKEISSRLGGILQCSLSSAMAAAKPAINAHMPKTNVVTRHKAAKKSKEKVLQRFNMKCYLKHLQSNIKSTLLMFWVNLYLSFDPKFLCFTVSFRWPFSTPGGAFWIHLQSTNRARGQEVPCRRVEANTQGPRWCRLLVAMYCLVILYIIVHNSLSIYIYIYISYILQNALFSISWDVA